MPRSQRPIRPRHLVPVGLVVAIAMLSYFAHLVNLAVQRGHDRRPPASAAAPGMDETDTIAFATHTLVAPR